MSVALSSIVTLTAIPVVATILGGVVASLKTPSERTRSFVQHFAAGVVMAAVAGELLPEITKGHQPLGVVIGFALGVAVMLLIRQFAEHFENRETDPEGAAPDRSAPGMNLALIGVVGIDVLIDGLLIGVGFAAGERVGTLQVIALTLELLFLGVSVVSSLRQRGVTRQQSVQVVVGLSVLVILGALLGGSLLQGLTGLALEIVLSFGAAALMFLVVEELLTEAHSVKETPLNTASFFMGFVALYLLEILG